MPRDFDTLFAKVALHNKLMSQEQIQQCLAIQKDLEEAGKPRAFAVLAVEARVISREGAQKIIAAINKKMPGRHPALVELAKGAAEAQKPAAAPAKPQPRPAKRSAPRPAAKPSSSRKKALILAAAATSVVGLAIAVLLVQSMSGPPPQPPAPAEAPPEEAPPVAQPPEPGPPQPPATPATAKAPEETAPTKREEPPPQEPGREAAFRAKLEQDRKKAGERLKEALQELEEENREEEEMAAKLRERMSAKPLTLKLRSGKEYQRAKVLSYTFSDLEIEAWGETASLPWNSITADSVRAASDEIFKPAPNAEPADAAAAHFDRGRFLITRRLWKEAKAALEKAVELDEEYEWQVEDILDILGRLAAGKGSFRGDSRRIGPDGIQLTYDFSDPSQLEDFTPGLRISEGKAVAEAPCTVILTGAGSGGAGSPLSRMLTFLDDIEIETDVSTDSTVAFIFFASKFGGFEMHVGPDGASIHRINVSATSPADRLQKLGDNPAAKLSKAGKQKLHITARGRKFKLFLDRKEVFTADVPALEGEEDHPRGAFGIRLEKGKAAFHAPMIIRGNLDPREISKRFSEMEVLARRAVNPDLEEVEHLLNRDLARQLVGARGSNIRLTADDTYFTLDMGADLARYDEVKQALAEFLSEGKRREDAEKGLEELIGKYEKVPPLYYLRALFNLYAQKMVEAHRDVDKALELFPEFPEALTLKGRLYDWDAEYDKALEAVGEALKHKPDHVDAYVLRAMSRHANDPSTAEQCLQDLRIALKLEPRNREAPTWLRVLKYASNGPRDLGCRFRHESDHYVIVTDISEAAAKLYAERLEAAFAHYAESFKDWYKEKPFRKPRVAVFNTAENYYTYFELLSERRGHNTLGVFRRRLNELVLFENVDIEESLSTLYHEAFHHFTTLMMSHTLPYWYNEGIAEYMSGIKVKDGKVAEKALVQSDRLRTLQLFLRMGSVLPFENIMCQTPREFYSGPVPLKYAQAWAMVHFFYEHDGGKHRPLIEKYFAKLRDRTPPRQAYEEVFQEKADDLQKEWNKYARGLKP